VALLEGARHAASMASAITRRQVADRLGLSISSVRRLEREGVLTPEIGEGGVRLFSAEQVEQVRMHREAEPKAQPAPSVAEALVPIDGALAALAFAHFDQGETPIQVVQVLELPPRTVKQLYSEWRELGDLALEGW